MTILTQLFEIIVLKRRTSDVTYDPTAAGLAIAASIASSYFRIRSDVTFPQELLPHSFSIAALLTFTQAMIFYFLLAANEKQSRLIQTYTALFGTSALLQLLDLIVLQVSVSNIVIIRSFLIVWAAYLAVIILRDAIESTLIKSILITLAYQIIVFFILVVTVSTFFPDAVKTTIETKDTLTG